MRGQLTVGLILGILVAILALINPELLARQVTASVFGYPYEGPLAVIFLVLVPGTWLLLLFVGAGAEWTLQRRIRVLAKDLAARDQEIVALKALAFDREHTPPVGAGTPEAPSIALG